MTKISCDRCGGETNRAYYNAGACERFNNVPYSVLLAEGTNISGESIIERKTLSYDLCEDCFIGAREVIIKFLKSKPREKDEI